jgi:hypothetical protein
LNLGNKQEFCKEMESYSSSTFFCNYELSVFDIRPAQTSVAAEVFLNLQAIFYSLLMNAAEVFLNLQAVLLNAAEGQVEYYLKEQINWSVTTTNTWQRVFKTKEPENRWSIILLGYGRGT